MAALGHVYLDQVRNGTGRHQRTYWFNAGIRRSDYRNTVRLDTVRRISSKPD